MKRSSTQFRMVLTAIAGAVAVCACGGGSDSSPSATPAASVQGTVASGAAIANANVTATDVNGKTASTTAGADGTYTLKVGQLNAPVVVVATDPQGRSDPLVSVIAALPAAGTSSTVNVTTLTTAIGDLLTASGNALDLTTPATLGANVQVAAVQKASGTLNSALADILQQNGLSTASFDAISTPFTANQTGADAVIDSVQLLSNGSGTTLVSNGSPAQGVLLNAQTAAPSTPLASAPVAANYLGFMSGLLQSCLSAQVSQRSTNASCAAAFDAHYTDNGYTSIDDYVGAFQLATSVGASVGQPVTLQFFKDASNVQSALVRIPYTLTDGTQGTFVTTVHALAAPVTLPDGSTASWSIVGNQLKYDARTESRITLRTFLDSFADSTGSADVSHYDAGMSFVFNPAGPNASTVNAVQVTGPGLPSGGLFLFRSSACGTANYLAIPGTKPATLPPTSSFTVSSDTNEYRWSWQNVAGTSPNFSPPSKYFWDTSQLDPSSVPFYPQYTFALFDASGNSLDSFTVTSATPVVSANLGATTPWATIGQDVVANFLTPGGSAANAAASASVDWTPNADAPPMIGVAVLTLGNSASGIDGFTSVQGNATSATVTAGVDTTGAQTCAGSQFLPLVDGNYRIVQLRAKSANGIRFFQNVTYRNGASAPNAS
ncbi:carboxypeptidase-like regulatory domain-containing protein [Paraburkholderia sp. J67]|uniref:carboxypeptidase-like regulatory domain-containing protein n=1 Tax=Paraburkholderia sp. J67 TaxID=2805435 RepID=UPI002ABE2425|nr:carboxypeptidase-like regulatory domain-containing protein [Paraburkholderia sp. J67]